jgi:TPP-dependent indolepyruvate ferredoxin oxidoreductase alpha subunit
MNATRYQETPFVVFDSRRCKACRRCRCEANCPEVIGSIRSFWHKHVRINYPDRCIGCLQCINLCPAGAFSERISNHAVNE